MRTAFSRKQKARLASAVVIVLAIIVLFSAIVISLITATRLERQASHYYAQSVQADLLARMGVDQVKAALQTAIAQSNTWISSPGVIYYASGPLSGSPTFSPLYLFSGSPAAPADGVNVDAPYFDPDSSGSSFKTLVTGGSDTNTPFAVSWIYVHQSGKTDAGSPVLSAADPVIGRFAYWTDDESARLDLNTAYARQNDVPLNSPSQVNLLALSNLDQSMADEISLSASDIPFATPAEARRLSGPIAEALSANRFAITHAGFSALRRNPWGDYPIYLTTKSNNLPPEVLAKSNYKDYYLSVLPNEALDAGTPLISTADLANYFTVMARLMNLMSTNNWPYVSGNFRTKYGEYYLAQTAMNIIEYVRSVESGYSIVRPVRLVYNGGTSFTYDGNIHKAATNVLAGASRRPMTTEMKAVVHSVTPGPSASSATWSYKVEVAVPKGYNVSSNIFSQFITLLSVRWPAYQSNGAVYGGANQFYSLSAHRTSPDRVQEDGNFYFGIYTGTNVAAAMPNIDGAADAHQRLYLPTNAIYTRVQVYDSAGQTYDLAPNNSPTTIADVTNTATGFIRDPQGTIPDFTESYQIDDPRLGRALTSWYKASASFGARNASWSVPMTATPPQDRNGSAVADDAVYIMPRKGVTSGDGIVGQGTVGSVAELGFVFTGFPFRSLFLQSGGTAGNPPDWMLLDVFAAPPQTNAGRYQPVIQSSTSRDGGRVAAGRVNLNARLQPFTNISRTMPLAGLFLGGLDTNNVRVDAPTAQVFATNVLSGTNLPAWGDLPELYISAGALALTKDLSTTEMSERRLLGAVDVATVQGKAFRVYSIGQSIKQKTSTPLNLGSLVVESERRLEATVVPQDVSPYSKVIYWKVIR